MTRYYPRELRFRAISFEDSPFDEKMLELAPSKELLRDWKEDKISWNKYRERFLNKLEDKELVGTIARRNSRRVSIDCSDGRYLIPYSQVNKV